MTAVLDAPRSGRRRAEGAASGEEEVRERRRSLDNDPDVIDAENRHEAAWDHALVYVVFAIGGIVVVSLMGLSGLIGFPATATGIICLASTALITSFTIVGAAILRRRAAREVAAAKVPYVGPERRGKHA